MKNTKTDNARRLSKEKKSKNKWKERALSYQNRLRKNRISLRDMTFSRDKWQIRAIKAENLLKEKDAEIELLKQKLYNLEKNQNKPVNKPEILADR